MAVPKETIWECAPHTRAKHLILQKYLQAWYPILAKYNPKVIYIDGFAGPGQYIKGEKGSPIVALDVAKQHGERLTGELSFLFVESEPKRAEHLNSVIKSDTYPDNFKIKVDNREFKTVLEAVLNRIYEGDLQNAPIFAFIDPFGFSGVPYSLISRLLMLPRTEVFVYFAREGVNRFLTQPDVEHHIHELFGLEKIEIPKGPNRSAQLKILYESRLKEVAKYVGSFTMLDDKGQPIYDLFFASNHCLGYVKMKEAMWGVDESGGFRFSDKDDPNQGTLFKNDPVSPLIKILKEMGNQRKNVNVDEIEKYVNEETVFLAKHMKVGLRRMESENEVYVHPVKADGQPRKGRFFANGTIIDFN